jgi:predicted aconitase with swiveling domain
VPAAGQTAYVPIHFQVRKATAVILNAECKAITAVGCIITEIPLIAHITIEALSTGDYLRVDGSAGSVEMIPSNRA